MLRRTQPARNGGVTEIIEKWTRKRFYQATALSGASSVALVAAGHVASGGSLLVLTGAFAYRGWKDINNTKHTLLRNFPVLAHVRYIFESVRPEIRQYFVESENEENPFSREQRALVYQRATGDTDSQPFGTRRSVYAENHEWVTHSIFPKERIPVADARVIFGANNCAKPYSASLLNVSAMSYGALSHAAIRAFNGGAKLGSFFSNTGEGGLSRFHLEQGGDLVWNIGSGYFGCRTKEGNFDIDMFRDMSQREQVRMIEIKLSQGAKPGLGGVLPAAKVTAMIAEARRVPVGQTCYSPASHSAFSSPDQLLDFAATLREASGGKPVGIKLCVGDPIELATIIRRSMERKIYLDFITVDGAEGGTGAAPAEFVTNVGTPLNEGLYFVHNMLRGAGIRQHTRVIASGKIVTGFSLFRALHLGADTCNSARGFMFSIGCIQSLKCNTNTCPTGIATQDEELIGGLNVADKRVRAANFQRKTVESALDIVSACGFTSLGEVRNRPVLMVRMSPTSAAFSSELFPKLKDRELVVADAGEQRERLQASLQGMTMKDRLVRAWVISGDPSLQPKIKLYMKS